MTREEAKIFLYSISGDLGFTDAENYTCKDGEKMREAIKALEQEPKTGHWIEKDGFDGDTYYDCSECGESWTTIEGTPWKNGMNYCPNCGCRMATGKERIND